MLVENVLTGCDGCSNKMHLKSICLVVQFHNRILGLKVATQEISLLYIINVQMVITFIVGLVITFTVGSIL